MEDVGECIDKDNMIQCTPYFGVTNVVMNGIEPGQGLEEKLMNCNWLPVKLIIDFDRIFIIT